MNTPAPTTEQALFLAQLLLTQIKGMARDNLRISKNEVNFTGESQTGIYESNADIVYIKLDDRPDELALKVARAFDQLAEKPARRLYIKVDHHSMSNYVLWSLSAQK
jgi:hypothetical protein